MAQQAKSKHNCEWTKEVGEKLKRVCWEKIAKTQASASATLSIAANAKTNMKSESSDRKQLENHKQNQQLGDY